MPDWSPTRVPPVRDWERTVHHWPPAKPAHKRAPGLLRVVGTLHMLLGGLLLAVMIVYVAMWASEGRGAFDAAWRELYGELAWAPLMFSLWICIAAAHLVGGSLVKRCRRSGRWVLTACAVLWLGRGLADTARADVDAGTLLFDYLLPLLTLFALHVRHRGVWKSAEPSRQLTV